MSFCLAIGRWQPVVLPQYHMRVPLTLGSAQRNPLPPSVWARDAAFTATPNAGGATPVAWGKEGGAVWRTWHLMN